MDDLKKVYFECVAAKGHAAATAAVHAVTGQYFLDKVPDDLIAATIKELIDVLQTPLRSQ